MSWSAFRTSYVRYTKRPAANRIAARRAWDYFAEKGPIEWIRLLDGQWGCCRPGQTVIDEIDAIAFRREHWQTKEERKP